MVLNESALADASESNGMTPPDLQQAGVSQPLAPQSNYENALLNGAQFSNVQLKNIHFSRSQLEGAQFHQAHIQQCRFIQTNMSRIQARSAIFHACNFTDAILEEGQFEQGYFSHSKFRRANCRFVQFTNARLVQADLRDADFHGANLEAADLRGADLRGAVLLEADLKKADLLGAKYNIHTKFPIGFHPEKRGMKKMGWVHSDYEGFKQMTAQIATIFFSGFIAASLTYFFSHTNFYNLYWQWVQWGNQWYWYFQKHPLF